MSHDHEPLDPHLRLLRYIAAGVVLGITVLYISADFVNLPFVRLDFHADQITIGSLFGALFILLGLLAAPKWPWGKP